KDAGMTTRREFEITELTAPTRIRWHERSRNLITADEGGYDLEPTPDGGTHVRLYNVLEGHGVGKLLLPVAGGAARKDAPAFGQRIKTAVEAHCPCTTRWPGGALGEIPPRGVRESRPRMISRRIPLLASEDEEAVVTDARAGAGGFAYGRGRGSRVVGEASQGRGGARGAGGGGGHRARAVGGVRGDGGVGLRAGPRAAFPAADDLSGSRHPGRVGARRLQGAARSTADGRRGGGGPARGSGARRAASRAAPFGSGTGQRAAADLGPRHVVRRRAGGVLVPRRGRTLGGRAAALRR